MLRDVLLGHRPIGTDDWFLSHLVQTGGNTQALYEDDHKGFLELLEEAEVYRQLTIVGNSYRTSQQQATLRNKASRTLVLLMPEPGNPHDKNAVACLASQGLEPEGFTWRHVGYLPKHTAAQLAPCWPTSQTGVPMLVHATLRDSKAERSKASVIYLERISDMYSANVRARDVTAFI